MTLNVQEPETEAVSDEELPAAAPADLGETESVSEDELPPDSEKKRKGVAKSISKTPDKKVKVESGGEYTFNNVSVDFLKLLSLHTFLMLSVKRKLNAEGEYDPSSPTSENNDETPAKKAALSSEADATEKQEAKPEASPKKKTLPELEKYWKAVNEDPSDFTGWTYLLQYVDQEVSKQIYIIFILRSLQNDVYTLLSDNLVLIKRNRRKEPKLVELTINCCVTFLRTTRRPHARLTPSSWSVIHIATATGESSPITRRRRATPKMSKRWVRSYINAH